MTDDNKRRAERFGVNDEFANLDGDEGVTFVSDLSEHGVFVHTRHRIDIGELIDLRFTLVLDDPVVIGARGKVVRHAEGGMGVEFTDLTPEMVLRIHDAISRQRALRQESEKLKTQAVAARAATKGPPRLKTPRGPGVFDDAKTGVFQVPLVDPADIHDDDDDDDDR